MRYSDWSTLDIGKNAEDETKLYSKIIVSSCAIEIHII